MQVTLWVLVELLTYEGAFMRSVDAKELVNDSFVTTYYETEAACHKVLLSYAKPDYKIYRSQEVKRLTVQYSLSEKHEAFMYCNPFRINENALKFLHIKKR